jgi:hypothetical protein
MNGEAETKICPLCAETIKAGAKVCPHCRHFQTRWSLQNPVMLASIWFVFVFAVLVCIGTFWERAFGPKQEFALYRDQIDIVRSQCSQRVIGSNLLNTVVGTLTNRSDVAWKDVGVEGQFFDKTGKLIDAITVNADDFHGVTVLPHGEAAFKIEGKALRPEADYKTNLIVVRWAKDVNAWLP